MSITSYAQNFEDVVLWRALREVENGAYLDIGAHDPVVDSVSKAFYDAGWRGVHVEPEPQAAEKLREARPDETVLEVAVDKKPQKLTLYSFAGTGLSTGVKEIAEKHQSDGRDPEEIKVKTKTLSAILNQMEAPEIHWMKVDVEGMETAVLSSWGNATARPWVVIVESTVPNSKEESDLSWEKELTSRGYSFVRFDGLNRFYVHEDHKDLEEPLSIAPNVFDGFVISDTSSSSFSASIKKAKESAGRRYRKQIKDLKEKIEEKEELVAEAQKRSSDADDASLAEKQSEIDTLNRDLQWLKSRLEEVEADRDRLNDTVSAQATALARATEQISPEMADKLLEREAELQRAILQRENADSRFQLLQERLEAEHQHKLELVKELEQRLAQLAEVRASENKSYLSQLEQLQAERTKTAEQIERLEARDEWRANDLERMHNEHEQFTRELREAERQHKAEIEKLQEQLEAVRQEKLDLTEELEQRLAQAEKDYADLLLQDEEGQEALKQARDELKSLRQQTVDLEEELAQAHSAIENEELARQKAEVRAEEKALLANKLSAEFTTYRLNAESKAKETSAEYERSLNDARSKAAQAENERKAQHREFEAQKKLFLEETASQQKKIESQDSEIDRLSDDLDAAKKKQEELAEQSKELDTALRIAREAEASVRQKSFDYVDQLEVVQAKAEEERAVLQGRLVEAQAQVSQLDDMLQERIAHYEWRLADQRANLESEHSGVVNELAQTRSMIERFEAERASLQAHAAHLQTTLEARESSLHEHWSELLKRDAALHDREHALAGKDEQLAIARATINELEAAIESIRSSRSWALSAPVRWVSRVLRS